MELDLGKATKELMKHNEKNSEQQNGEINSILKSIDQIVKPNENL